MTEVASMDVVLPRLADTLVEGTVVRWFKQPGDSVRKGEPLFEVETEKVSTEVEAPAVGVLIEIRVPAGETVPVGDVLARLESAATATPASVKTHAEAPEVMPTTAERGGLSTMRRRIAERVQEARATIPQGACVRQLDLASFTRRDLGWTAYFVKALALAAGVSSVGVAVDVPTGLVVPVVRNADQLPLDDLSSRVRDLVESAREGRLAVQDVVGAQFTVTNVGAIGTLMAFPLVRPGEPGILAPGAVRNGSCFVTLCYDRRAMDDFEADRLLARVEEGMLSLA